MILHSAWQIPALAPLGPNTTSRRYRYEERDAGSRTVSRERIRTRDLQLNPECRSARKCQALAERAVDMAFAQDSR